ncbi:MAG: ATP-binding protein [Hyphomicrobiaceae bacterium]
MELVNDGFGVSTSDTERIFDRFFTSKREHGGTSLGLSTARSLLNACGGHLSKCKVQDFACYAAQQAPTYHIEYQVDW